MGRVIKESERTNEARDAVLGGVVEGGEERADLSGDGGDVDDVVA